ncbi:MAG TPA: secretin N-terminal domain-containing protein [Burkholderiales bacterium]|nr:secretin N-terminal domain-containing protein [Burkholderiales bacterium]
MMRIWPLAAVCLLLAACAGSMSYEESRQLMMQGDPELALKKLEDAMRANPGNAQYRQTYERERAVVVARYVSEGDLLRGSQQYPGAELAYQRALKLDPDSARAKAGMAAIDTARKQNEIVAKARADVASGKLDEAETALRALLEQSPGQRDAREVLNRIAELRAEAQAHQPAPALQGPFKQPITLEFRDATLKSVFEVMSRASGINFVFDRDVRADTKINIFVRNTSLDDVVKLILVTNQLERKLLNENTLLIYPNTPAKQKEYKELVVRSFYLANADVKQALNLVKGMVKTPDVFIDEKLNMLVVKDTPDAMRLIANLVRGLDLAEPEVMLEVEVLELSSSRLQELGVNYPDRINIGKVPTGVADAVTDVFQLGEDDLKGWVLNPPLVINLLGQDSDVKVLANPRIRVKNREKAKVHIGDRVPVITTTSTANVGVSSSVSYLDVGLKLDVESNVYLRDEVSIKVGLEVSNIRRVLDIQGTRAYELGTRNTATVLQLKDGETQVLAGLISDEDRRTADKVPGLGDFPILGRLFRTQSDDRRKTEIVLLITPRIVRSLNYPQSAAVDLSVGTDSAIGVKPLRIAPTQLGGLTIQPSGPAGAAPGALPRPVPVPVPGAQPPVPGTPSGVPPPGAEVAQPLPGAARPGGLPPGPVPDEEQDAAVAAAQPSSLLMAAPIAARSGSDIAVSLSLTAGGTASRATAELAYDPLQLEPVGAATSSPGRLPVRIDGSTAVRFRLLLAAGRAQVRVENVVGIDASGNTVPVAAPGPVEIAVNQ